MSSDDGEAVAAVAASEYRQAVLRRLMQGEATPSTIAEDAGLEQSHVSNRLSDLREHRLVALVVPEDTKKGRIYQITDEGREIADRLGIGGEDNAE